MNAIRYGGAKKIILKIFRKYRDQENILLNCLAKVPPHAVISPGRDFSNFFSPS